MLYRDVNGDGKIDSNDQVVFNGGIAPIYGGFNTRIAYKRVDLSHLMPNTLLVKRYMLCIKKDLYQAAL